MNCQVFLSIFLDIYLAAQVDTLIWCRSTIPVGMVTATRLLELCILMLLSAPLDPMITDLSQEDDQSNGEKILKAHCIGENFHSAHPHVLSSALISL
jgi:hypothetical protein